MSAEFELRHAACEGGVGEVACAGQAGQLVALPLLAYVHPADRLAGELLLKLCDGDFPVACGGGRRGQRAQVIIGA